MNIQIDKDLYWRLQTISAKTMLPINKVVTQLLDFHCGDEEVIGNLNDANDVKAEERKDVL